MDYKIGEIKSIIIVETVEEVNAYLKNNWILLHSFIDNTALKSQCVKFVIAELPNSTIPQFEPIAF